MIRSNHNLRILGLRSLITFLPSCVLCQPGFSLSSLYCRWMAGRDPYPNYHHGRKLPGRPTRIRSLALFLSHHHYPRLHQVQENIFLIIKEYRNTHNTRSLFLNAHSCIQVEKSHVRQDLQADTKQSLV